MSYQETWQGMDDLRPEEIEAMEREAEHLCRWAAARAGVIVVTPLLGTVALMANEVYLVTRLAKVYQKDIREGAIIGFIGSLGASMAGTLLGTLLPLPFLQVPIAVSVTYGVGKAAQAWIKAGMPTDMTPYAAMYKEWAATAKEQARVFAENPLKESPLGDETKEFLRNSGVKMGTALQDMKGRITDAVTANADTFLHTADSLRERAVMGAQHVLETDRLEATTQGVLDALELLKEHTLTLWESRKEELGTCPVDVEGLRDSAFWLRERAAALSDDVRQEVVTRCIGIADLLAECAELLTEYGALSREETLEAGRSRLQRVSQLLGEMTFLVKERMAMALPDTADIMETMVDTAHLCKEHLAVQTAGLSDSLQEVGEGAQEALYVARERLAMGAQACRDHVGTWSKGQKALAVGLLGTCALLTGIAFRVGDVWTDVRQRGVGEKDIQRLRKLSSEAKAVARRLQRTLEG